MDQLGSRSKEIHHNFSILSDFASLLRVGAVAPASLFENDGESQYERLSLTEWRFAEVDDGTQLHVRTCCCFAEGSDEVQLLVRTCVPPFRIVSREWLDGLR